MPRQSDTHQRVFETADQLLEKGIKPTQQNIREQIGSGSITTINKSLNLWWQQLSERIRLNRDRPDLPEQVIESANKLWQQALGYAENASQLRWQEAEERLAEERLRIEHKEKDLSESTEKYRAQVDRLLKDNERLQNDLASIHKALLEQESESIRLGNQNAALKLEARQQTAVILQLEKKTAAVHNQQTAPHPVQLDIEHQVSIRMAEERTRELEQRTKQLQQENHELLGKLHQAEKDALAKQFALETVIAQQDVKYDQLQQELTRYRKRYDK